MKINKFNIFLFGANLLCVIAGIYGVLNSINITSSVIWVMCILFNLIPLFINPVGIEIVFFIKGYIGKLYKFLGKSLYHVGNKLDNK